MEGVSLISGPGWVIGGIYFISNVVIKGKTGASIGQHLGNFAKNLDITNQMDLKNFNGDLIGGKN